MPQQPPLPVRRDVHHAAGREPAAPGRLEALEVTEQRPLVIEIGGLLDAVPIAILVARGRGAALACLLRRHRVEYDVLVRLAQVPVQPLPAVPEARTME